MTNSKTVEPAQKNFRYYDFVMAAGVHDLVPGLRIVHAAGADLAGDAVMINFADARRKISIRLKQFRQRHDIGQNFSEIQRVAEDLSGVGSATGHERGAARIAERVLAISAFKQHAAPG